MIKYLIAVVLFILIGYGCIEAWPLLAGPGLVVTSPQNNASFPGGIVAIAGKAPRAAELTLNGAPLLHDQDGSFSSTLTFPRGGSILTFVATDRFGRVVTATRSIFVPADASVGSPTSNVGAN
jgi:Glucodextranase, domain B